MLAAVINDKDWQQVDSFLEGLVSQSRLNQQTTKTEKLLKTIKIKRHEKRIIQI